MNLYGSHHRCCIMYFGEQASKFGRVVREKSVRERKRLEEVKYKAIIEILERFSPFHLLKLQLGIIQTDDLSFNTK